jgi:hypothetical protein
VILIVHASIVVTTPKQEQEQSTPAYSSLQHSVVFSRKPAFFSFARLAIPAAFLQSLNSFFNLAKVWILNQ